MATEVYCEKITLNTANSSVGCPSLAEQIACFVSTWGRWSPENNVGCMHPRGQMCEQYGCFSFEELADAIRTKFGKRR